jgi:hypothetical protein
VSAPEVSDYCRRGWQPVPISLREKGPSLPGWGKLRLKIEDLPRYFDGHCNIGIILWPPSGHLVDVDLDCPEALVLAERYLLPTGRNLAERQNRGRIASTLRSGPSMRQFADPLDGAMLLELRSEGRDGGRSDGFPAFDTPQGRIYYVV